MDRHGGTEVTACSKETKVVDQRVRETLKETTGPRAQGLARPAEDSCYCLCPFHIAGVSAGSPESQYWERTRMEIIEKSKTPLCWLKEARHCSDEDEGLQLCRA